MNMITPYNDDKMVFDKDQSMYLLTREYVKEELGNPYRDDKTLDRRIKKTSTIIYNYIYKTGNSQNRKIVEIILNKTENGRKFLLDLLTAQMEADIETGINSLGNVPRINIKNGQVLDQQAMATAYISQYAQDILDTCTGRLGLNILYQGIYPPYVWLMYKGY